MQHTIGNSSMSLCGSRCQPPTFDIRACQAPRLCWSRHIKPRPAMRNVASTKLCRRRALVVSRASASNAQETLPFKSSGQVRWWSMLDATATIGSIIGALAFVITSEAMLAGIVAVLPLVAWYAGRQKEHLQIEAAIQRAASRWAVQSMSPHAAAESITSALQQLQKDSQQQVLIAKHVRGIEAKVNALEGSVLTAGINAQEAARQVSACSDKVAERTQAQIRDFSGAIQSNGLSALQRLNAQLTSIEGRLAEVQAERGKQSQDVPMQGDIQAVLRETRSFQHALEDMQQQNAESASKLPTVMSEALQAALLQAKQAGLLDAAAPSQNSGQVESLSDDAQYQLRSLISEGLGEAVQHMMHAQEKAQNLPSAADETIINQLKALEHRLQERVQDVPSAGMIISKLNDLEHWLQERAQDVPSAAEDTIISKLNELEDRLQEKAQNVPSATDDTIISKLNDLEHRLQERAQNISSVADEAIINKLNDLESKLQELQSTPSEAPPQLSQMHTQLDAILTAVGQSQSLSQTVSEARDQIHTLLDRLPDASATAAPAGVADQKLTNSIADIQDAQQDIQKELKALQTALSKGNLPPEETQQAQQDIQRELAALQAAVSKGTNFPSEQIQQAQQEIRQDLATLQAAFSSKSELPSEQAQQAQQDIQKELANLQAAFAKSSFPSEQGQQAQQDIQKELAALRAAILEGSAPSEQIQQAQQDLQSELKELRAAFSAKGDLPSQQVQQAQQDIQKELAAVRAAVLEGSLPSEQIQQAQQDIQKELASLQAAFTKSNSLLSEDAQRAQRDIQKELAALQSAVLEGSLPFEQNQQAQQDIQKELAALQSAFAKGNLPSEQIQQAQQEIQKELKDLQAAITQGNLPSEQIQQAQQDIQKELAALQTAVAKGNSPSEQIQQAQQDIKKELSALQAAFAKGSLPTEQTPDQKAAAASQKALLGKVETLLGAMQEFGTRMTSQVDSLTQQVTELSTAQTKAQSGERGQTIFGVTAGSADVPLTVAEPVQQPLIQEDQESRQSAYDRMQELLQERSSSSDGASSSGKDDQAPVKAAPSVSGLADGSAQQQYKPVLPSSNSDNIKEQVAFAAGLAAAGQVPLDTSEEQWWDQQAVTSTQDDSQPPPVTTVISQQSQQGVQSTPSIQVDMYQQQQQPADQPKGKLSDQLSVQEAEKQMDPILAPSLYSEGMGRSMATEFQRTSEDSGSGRMATDFQRTSEDSSSAQQMLDFQQNSRVSSSAQQMPEVSQSTSDAQYNEPSASSSKVQSRSSSQQLSSEQLTQQPQQSLVEVELQLQRSDEGGEEEEVEVEQMSFEQRLEAGRECFRSARSELETGSLGAASSLMTAALNYFEAASQLDSTDTKLMGSWGNALLAYGGLKKQLLEAVSDTPAPGPIEASAVAASKAQILQEASEALIDAGHKFQAIAQENLDDTKALTNWAKSICIRASLKDKPEEAMRLYSSAVDKFEKVLAVKADNVEVLVICGLALKDMALCMSLDDPDTVINLEDSEACMEQAIGFDAENEAAKAGLAECQDRLRVCREYATQKA